MPFSHNYKHYSTTPNKERLYFVLQNRVYYVIILFFRGKFEDAVRS